MLQGPEVRHHTHRMPRRQHTAHLGIAQCDNIPVFQLHIRDKALIIMPQLPVHHLHTSRVLTHVPGVHPAYEGLCSGKVGQGRRRAEVVCVRVGHHYVLNIPGIEAQYRNIEKQSGQAARCGCVQQNQAVSRIDQMGAAPEIPYKIEVSRDGESGAVHQVGSPAVLPCRVHIPKTIESFQIFASLPTHFQRHGRALFGKMIVIDLDRKVNLI